MVHRPDLTAVGVVHRPDLTAVGVPRRLDPTEAAQSAHTEVALPQVHIAVVQVVRTEAALGARVVPEAEVDPVLDLTGAAVDRPLDPTGADPEVVPGAAVAPEAGVGPARVAADLEVGRGAGRDTVAEANRGRAAGAALHTAGKPPNREAQLPREATLTTATKSTQLVSWDSAISSKHRKKKIPLQCFLCWFVQVSGW